MEFIPPPLADLNLMADPQMHFIVTTKDGVIYKLKREDGLMLQWVSAESMNFSR